MKGKYNVIIYDSRLRYDLVIDRQITILKGNSGTGKSTLVNMVSLLLSDDRGTGIHCNVKDLVEIIRDKRRFVQEIREAHNKIFFIDERSDFIMTKEFAETVNGSDNYFVLVSRFGVFDWLTYSVDSVYELGTQTKGIVNVTKLYRRYNNVVGKVKPDLVITEDKIQVLR